MRIQNSATCTPSCLSPYKIILSGDSQSQQVDGLGRKEESEGCEKVQKETESFESLFCQLSVMKEQSARLPPQQRKLYAEQMALAFYAAMGVDDDTDEE